MINNILENELEIKGLSGESLDILEEKINKIKEIFPEAICEGKIDFERLSEELGHFKEDKEERYRFEWAGKREAIKIAQTPSMGTLRPCKEESKNWDTTQNLYIEGDNLEVLKLLQKSYQNKVKMIYIDPPYNKEKDFIYKDKFKLSLDDYKRKSGYYNYENLVTTTKKEFSGRYHSEWLTMMYSRLKISRGLLEDDGIIFISIDNKEFSNLINICNEIFGEENFRGILKWKKRSSGGQVKDGAIINQVEYIICYSKSDKFKFKGLKNLNIGEMKWRDFRKSGGEWQRKYRPNQYFPFYYEEKMIL